MWTFTEIVKNALLTLVHSFHTSLFASARAPLMRYSFERRKKNS